MKQKAQTAEPVKLQTPPTKAVSKKQKGKQAVKAKGKAKSKRKAKAKSTKPRKGKLGELLGHSVVSVIRAMGKHGWNFETAKAALDKAGIEAATHTVKIGLKRGRDGEKKIAPLSAKELDTLRAAPKAKANANAEKKGE